MPRPRQALLTAVMAWPAAAGAVSDSFAKPATSSPASAMNVASGESAGRCILCVIQSSNGSTVTSSKPGMSECVSKSTSYIPRASSGCCAQVTISIAEDGPDPGPQDDAILADQVVDVILSAIPE